MLRQPDRLSDGGQTLTLRQLTPADAGRYVCEASNSAGTAAKRFNLRVTGTLRLPHTGPLTRVAGLRGGRYFNHFEVVRVIKFAACMSKGTQRYTKNDYLLQYPQFYFWFSAKVT